METRIENGALGVSKVRPLLCNRRRMGRLRLDLVEKEGDYQVGNKVSRYFVNTVFEQHTREKHKVQLEKVCIRNGFFGCKLLYCPTYQGKEKSKDSQKE